MHINSSEAEQLDADQQHCPCGSYNLLSSEVQDMQAIMLLSTRIHHAVVHHATTDSCIFSNLPFGSLAG